MEPVESKRSVSLKGAKMAKHGKIIVGLVALFVVLAVAGYTLWKIFNDGGEVKQVTAANVWEDVLKACAQNDTLRPENMVYLGPSNDLGVGTIWRKMDGSSGYELKRLPPKELKESVREGGWSSCSGSKPASFGVESGADIVFSRVKGVSGYLAAELKRAKKVELKVEQWREVKLEGDKFNDWINGLRNEDPYKLSLLKGGRVVAYRVIEVKGMSATLTFDEADAVTLKGKFAPGEVKEVGEGNANLKAEFKGGNSLLIVAPGTFVIEAEFGKYDPATGDVKGGKITPLESEKEAKVSKDLEKQ